MRYICILVISFIVIPNTTFSQQDFYGDRWTQVYKFEVNGLQQSALKVTDEIYARSKREQNIQQLTKSLFYQSKFALTQPNAELLIVNKWQAEITQAKAPLKNILESILANLYWQYFQANRWKYYNRSRSKEVINEKDFRTWDAEAMYKEINKYYEFSLENDAVLKATSLKAIDEILTDAENSKLYRPTLYDFIAHQALDFYSTNESYLQRFDNEIDFKNPSYFEQIEKITLPENSLSPTAHVVQLYQNLLSFHSNDKEPYAFINLQIEWIKFLADREVFDNEKELKKMAFSKLLEKFQGHAASAQASFELANMLYEEGLLYNPKSNTNYQFRKKEALVLCEDVIIKFPNSDGAAKCSVLKEHIVNKQLSLQLEGFIPINSYSKVYVSYTNLDSLTFEAYHVTEEFRELFFTKMNDSTRTSELSKLKISNQWSARVKNLNDYQEHSTEVVIPPLSGGMYLIVSRVPNSSIKDSPLFAFASIQVTNLALVEASFEELTRFQVVDRNTGKPIPGADVHLLSSGNNSYNSPIDQHFITDKNGFIEIKKQKKYNPRFNTIITYKEDKAIVGDYTIYPNYRDNDEDDESITARAFLFTDRSIYRPGQTVYFKGILIKTKEKKSSVVGGQYVEVYLDDVNGEEIGSLRLKTNQYGSFSGEFNLPPTGITGEYTLYTEEDSEEDSKFYDDLDNFEDAYVNISVEEYKRPTFEVTFKPLSGEYKVIDSVTVTGNAIAFNGSKIGNAKVNYSVKRTVRYPHWYYWSNRYGSPNEKEITSGEVVTNSNGEFTITFIADPDKEVSKENLPIFHYEVTADVTDINGETRSATSTVNVGYHSLQAALQVPEKVNLNSTDNTMAVSIENLNAQPISASGNISIFKVKTPGHVTRPRPWEEPDLPILSQEEFNTLFPNEMYIREGTAKRPEKGKLMLEIPFNTALTKEVKWSVEKTWQPGSYVVELQTKDKDGIEVSDISRFTVVDPVGKSVSDNNIFLVELDKNQYVIGEVAKLKIGSASSDMTITVDIEKKYKNSKTYVEHFSGNSKVLTIPITEDMEGGFTIHISGVNYNSFFNESKNIRVYALREKMEIETITFKDKLQPGAKQTWSFEIKSDNQPLLEAEVLASMYDASLDQFKPHEWSFSPIREPYYYSYHKVSANKNFMNHDFIVRNKVFSYYTYPQQFYDQLDWFGFTITNNAYVRNQYLARLYSTGMTAGAPSKVSTSVNKNLRKGFISGTITSAEDGSPLPGVNVIVKGTTRGTATDMHGNYTIEASKNEELVFSFIGLATTEAKVGNRNIMNVAMAMDVTQLSEVVVTALGVVVEKKSLGYSVSQILSNDDESDAVFYALNGKAAGVQVTGMPGGAAGIMIRGAATLSGDNQPLYIVDGVIVNSHTLDQTDLASVQVLKGQAATTLYGARAANGVIIITTKSGQKKMDEEMAKVNTRKDFKETAFFFPHLTTDVSGKIRFTFTTPESLTRWKLQLLAHTKDLNSTIKTLQSVTQKELMVTPNAPRFLRIGDEIILSTKISNLTGKSKTGTAALQLLNAVTGEDIDALFKNVVRNQPFKVAAKGSTEVSWKLTVPAGIDAVQYKVVAKAGNYSDGEQNALPILSNRMLVTETMPMYVRGGEAKTFNLDKLKNTQSTTLQHHQLTLEVSSNPAWYAVQALPYLMEFPYECAEQLFSRYYANTLASHIVNSNPKIKAVFDDWVSSNALISNLEKNQELKNILIQETPWVRDAQNETERKKRIALLFDLNTIGNQLETVIIKLQELQLSNGGFTWFAGGKYPSRYITQHIASGFGHLQHLNIKQDVDVSSIQRNAIAFLDNEIVRDYNAIMEQEHKLKMNKNGPQLYKEFINKQHISSIQIQYLYMRSFYADVQMSAEVQRAVDYYRAQSARYWLNFNIYMKGMIALIHNRAQNQSLAKQILLSLKENSIQSDEMGMYWKENKPSWYWYESPVETQALLIEAFAEIDYTNATEKQQTLDNLKIWLLKNKQTNQWKTTKATTEAVYALLMAGTDWLAVDNQLEVTVANKKIEPADKPEAGTGYFKTSWKGEAISPAMNEVKLSSKNKSIAWAGLYWQYFEDLDKITSSETPLKLSKKVFVVNRDDKGEILTEVNANTPVAVGNLLRVRIELKADRPMEFLHMKDMRASGLEPIDVLSEYKWQEGLWYYQSTKDASTNFFFDSVNPGVYVFEYDLRANNKGDFSNGITTIQCMYAPEFSSHSEGIKILVK
jgi:TonB-dependent SusC/RagA subfamily outer membrane receptor